MKLPFERLAFVLSSNSLKHCTELELFKAACRWLRFEEPRMEYAAKLMKNIRFPLMTPQDLINYVQTVDFMRTDNTCVNLLLEASNYQMMPYMQPVMQSERTAIRSDSTHLVTLGGVLRQQLVVSKELRMYDEKAHEWKSLAPMDAPRYQHGIAVIGNFLYVVGGQSNYDTKGKTAVDTVFRFDPRYNKWMQVASLNEKRTFFHLSALKGHLYAVGGRNAAGELGKHCKYDSLPFFSGLELLRCPMNGGRENWVCWRAASVWQSRKCIGKLVSIAVSCFRRTSIQTKIKGTCISCPDAKYPISSPLSSTCKIICMKWVCTAV